MASVSIGKTEPDGFFKIEKEDGVKLKSEDKVDLDDSQNFIKEDEEKGDMKTKEEDKPPQDFSSTSSAEMQDLFADFMSEVGSIPVSNGKPKKIGVLPGFLFENSKGNVRIVEEEDGTIRTSVVSDVPIRIQFGTAADECERLTSKTFSNMFEVLRLPADASEDDIKKAYKKISLLIHPDKCKHEKAGEAFDVANKAYEELQKPELKGKYRLVIAEAKKRVLNQIRKENKNRKQQNEELLSMKDEDIQEEITAMCDTLLKQVQENLNYSEKCKKANEEWERKAEEEILEEARKEEELKRKWCETRDNRVGDWKEFKEEIRTKKVKVANFVPVAHQREQRTKKERGGLKKPMGIDESYKLNWR